MRPDVILWDWNGTLLDDAAYGLAVRNRVFPKFGLPTISDMAEYHAQFTFPVREYYRRGGVTDALFPAVAQAWFDEYVRGCAGLPLCPGAAEAVEFFHEAGCRQIIVSASEQALLREQLSRFAIADRFADVLGLRGIEAASKEGMARAYFASEGVDPARCLYFGDTLHDAQVAKALGVRCALVAQGHQSRQTLLTAGVPVLDDLWAAPALSHETRAARVFYGYLPKGAIRMQPKQRVIVLTGGGTAGHVTPHFALIPRLTAMGYQIHYLGTADGLERGMLAAYPQVQYHVIKSGKLRRYFSLQNFTDPFRVLAGFAESRRLMRRIKPDVVFSKGGFVSVPVVLAASRCHVPCVCHESDLTPGLANKISARYADRVATTFAECARALGPKAVQTGTPMRPELFAGSRAKGLALCGFDGRKPVLLMTGGSQGAQSVNAALRGALPRLLPVMDVVHLCGKGNRDESLAETKGYRQFEFLTAEMPDVLACADIVLSRAGSNTLSELLALGKPMLLVPYPKGASRGDQIENAESYRKQGLAMVLAQEDMTVETLSDNLFGLLKNKDTLRAAAEASPVKDGTEGVLALIEEVQRTY